MGHRDHRHVETDHAADLVRPDPARVDDDLAPHGSLVGLHARDPAPLDSDAAHAHAGADRDTALSGAGRQRGRERRRIDPAVGRQIGGALDPRDAHQGEEIARLMGRDQGQGEPEGACPADLAPELEQSLRRRSQSQAPDLAPARIEARVVAQSPIELDARHVDAGQRDGRAQLADEARRVERRARRQLGALDEQHVCPAELRQPVEDRAAAHAAADHHHLRPRLHRGEPTTRRQ